MNPKALLALLALAAISASAVAACAASAARLTECAAARVHYTPYPGSAPGLGQLPWVRGTSRGLGLVGLIWYWPTEWRDQHIDRALIYPGGKAPAGNNTKILWAFLSANAKRTFSGGDLLVRGQRLDGPGKTWQRFVSIGYDGRDGAPSYASVISLPSEGCWRLQLSAGELRASVVFQATATP